MGFGTSERSGIGLGRFRGLEEACSFESSGLLNFRIAKVKGLGIEVWAHPVIVTIMDEVMIFGSSYIFDYTTITGWVGPPKV